MPLKYLDKVNIKPHDIQLPGSRNPKSNAITSGYFCLDPTCSERDSKTRPGRWLESSQRNSSEYKKVPRNIVEIDYIRSLVLGRIRWSNSPNMSL